MIICKKYTCLVCVFNISILSWQEEDKIYIHLFDLKENIFYWNKECTA